MQGVCPHDKNHETFSLMADFLHVRTTDSDSAVSPLRLLWSFYITPHRDLISYTCWTTHSQISNQQIAWQKLDMTKMTCSNITSEWGWNYPVSRSALGENATHRTSTNSVGEVSHLQKRLDIVILKCLFKFSPVPPVHHYFYHRKLPPSLAYAAMLGEKCMHKTNDCIMFDKL